MAHMNCIGDKVLNTFSDIVWPPLFHYVWSDVWHEAALWFWIFQDQNLWTRGAT